MSELVANCPRCNAKEMTFDLIWALPTVMYYDWQQWFEAFCICRKCRRSTVFVVSQKNSEDTELIEEKTLARLPCAANRVVEIRDFICIKDFPAQEPPEYLPSNVEAAFREGAGSIAIGCPNAAATMFRLCIDLSTKGMLPQEDVNGLNRKVRRDLGLRLPWLFDNGILPQDLRELSTCIKDEGNDGAHEGTLSKDDAADILDFTLRLLERIYTEPKKVQLAKERREARRDKH